MTNLKSLLLLVAMLILTIEADAQSSQAYTSSDHLIHRRDQLGYRQTESGRTMQQQSGVKQQLDSIIEYNFDKEVGEWVEKFRKMNYSYDQNLKDTLFLLSGWDFENKSWENLWRETSSYDDFGNIEGWKAYSWSSSNFWYPMYQEQYDYNEDQQMIETRLYYWKYNLEDWLLVSKTAHYYHPDGRIKADTTYSMYSDSDEWILSENVQYTYTDGYLIETLKSSWDRKAEQWQNEEKVHMDYDEDWTHYATLSYHWDESASDWVDWEGERYGRDEDNNVYNYTTIQWNNENVLLGEYSFDYEIEREEIALPFYMENSDRMAFHHKITSKELRQYNQNTSGREKYREVKYYYSEAEVVTAVAGFDRSQVIVYPNPTTESIWIESEGAEQVQLIMCDINGREVLETTVQTGDRLDVASLKKGLYFYQIYWEDERVVGRLVVD